MVKIKIGQVRSRIQYNKSQKHILDGLGLRKMHQIVEHEDTLQIRSVVAKVHHLVQVIE